MRLSDRAKFYIGASATVAVALAASPALAQASGGLDQIVDVYKNGANAWGPSLRQYAISLFGLLATIEFVWSFARLTVKGADFGELASELLTRVMFIGFFYWLMIASGEIAPSIVESFRQAGDAASTAAGGSSKMRPNDIWRTGVEVSNAILSTKVGLDAGKFVALALAGLILIVCFALMAAAMIIALVEGYIIMNAGILLMGFGGSSWTKDIAVKTMTYAVSVGAKLFVIQILAGMSEVMVKSWTAGFSAAGAASPEYMSQILEIVGASIVMLALVFSIPNIVQGIINGSSPGSHNALTGAAAAVAGGVAGAAAVAAGGFMAGSGAMKLASEQMKAADAAGTGASTGLGRVGGFISATSKNLGQSAMSDVGAKLSGRVRGGNAAGRMGAAMNDQAAHMQKERTKPPAPGDGSGEAAEAAPSATGGDSSSAGGEGGEGGDGEGSIRPEGPISGASTAPEGSSEDVIHGAAPTPEPMLAGSGGGEQPQPYEASYGPTYGATYGQTDPDAGGAKGAKASAGPAAANAGAAATATDGAEASEVGSSAPAEESPARKTIVGANASGAPSAPSADGAASPGTIEGAASTSAPTDSSTPIAAKTPTQGPAKGLGGTLGRGSGPTRPAPASPKKPGR